MKRTLLWIANRIHQKYKTQRLNFGDMVATRHGYYKIVEYSYTIEVGGRDMINAKLYALPYYLNSGRVQEGER